MCFKYIFPIFDILLPKLTIVCYEESLLDFIDHYFFFLHFKSSIAYMDAFLPGGE